MLILKKNIYEISEFPHPENTDDQGLDPYNFIFHSLMTDREIFSASTIYPKVRGWKELKHYFHMHLFSGTFLSLTTFLEVCLKVW